MAEFGIPLLADKYPVTMDMWPVEDKQFNRVWEFYENLKQGRFTTTRCTSCGYVSWPPRLLCPECYAMEQMEWVDLPTRGKVLAFSEEVRGVPLGFDSPLIHAWIDLGEDSPIKKFLSRIANCPEGKLTEGAEVQLVVFDIPSHPMEVKRETVTCDRVFFAFEPVE
jgi:hypothetical protein